MQRHRLRQLLGGSMIGENCSLALLDIERMHLDSAEGHSSGKAFENERLNLGPRLKRLCGDCDFVAWNTWGRNL